MIGRIFLNSYVRKLPKYSYVKLPKYSYGRYLIENKKTSKEERRKALKKFLDVVYQNPTQNCSLV